MKTTAHFHVLGKGFSFQIATSHFAQVGTSRYQVRGRRWQKVAQKKIVKKVATKKKVVKKVAKKVKSKVIKDPNRYTNEDKFDKNVGILSEEQLVALGWDADNGNRICYSKHAELVKFIEKLNSHSIQFIKGGKVKKYHIATDVDAGDLEAEYMEKHGIDEDDEDRRVVASNILNRVAFVNRMDYFLCDGDDNEDLYLEFVEEI